MPLLLRAMDARAREWESERGCMREGGVVRKRGRLPVLPLLQREIDARKSPLAERRNCPGVRYSPARRNCVRVTGFKKNRVATPLSGGRDSLVRKSRLPYNPKMVKFGERWTRGRRRLPRGGTAQA